jgi:ribosomal protein L37AE/L43A
MGQGLLASLKSTVDQMESKVTAAEQSIEGLYDHFKQQIQTLSMHLDDIDYLLKQLAEASFQLLPTEAGIAAAKAIWCKTGKEQKGDPEGVLYLTDQRLIFEQKEEIATKKVLFVVTEKKKVQGLQLEAPVILVDKVDTSQQGMMKNEDHIEIRFASGAPVQMAHFHIWKDNAVWQALINRAKIKDFDKGRAVAVDQAAVEKARSAPTQCPSCGGTITAVVLRGMDTIKCEYCGLVIRLAETPTTVTASAIETKELLWGTTSPITVRLTTQISSVMANGKCSVAIQDPAVYQQKIGDDNTLQLQVRSLLALKFGDVLGQISSGITNADGLGARAVEIAGKIQEAANPDLAAMGVKLTRVTIDGFNVNPLR